MYEDFDTAFQQGSADFAAATEVSPAPMVRTRGDRRRRRRTLTATTLAMAAVTGVAAGAGAWTRPAPESGRTVRPPTVQSTTTTASAGCADADRARIEVPPGTSQDALANILDEAGVVKSAAAFLAAAAKNQAAQSIQAGVYRICRGISPDAAVRELLTSSNREPASRITVIPGEWKSDVFTALAIDLTALQGGRRTVTAADIGAAEMSGQIGLPDWAPQDNVEGFLMPGTYNLSSTDTPTTVLAHMVKARLDALNNVVLNGVSHKFTDLAVDLNCAPAKKCTPYQVLVIASMAQAEISTQYDASGVAEAIEHRLEDGLYVDVDATTLYGLNVKGRGPTLAEKADTTNLFSTATSSGHKLLSVIPGPIGNPTSDVIAGVLQPTGSGYYYWCTDNSGRTTFRTKKQGADPTCGRVSPTAAATTKK